MGILQKCFGVSGSKHKSSSGKQASTRIEELCHRFSLSQHRKLTDNFDTRRIMGRGSFGKVYKASILINGESKEIAVKRVEPGSSTQALPEFKNEILLLCQLQHPNLISLIGFCNDQNEMIMVFEYAPKASLRDQLYRRERSPELSWKRRLEISVGTARGLHYLHTGAKRTIFHCDVKTSNILLDENWVPRLTDFGHSVKGPKFSSKARAKPIEVDVITGTHGYMAPEYAAWGRLTDKSDVYSFGVVLVELVCGKRPSMILNIMAQEMKKDTIHQDVDVIRDKEGEQSSCFRNVAKEVRDYVESGNGERIIDPILVGKIAPECWKLYMDIAEICLNEDPNERPAIGEVEVELEHALELQEEADANNELFGNTTCTL